MIHGLMAEAEWLLAYEAVQRASAWLLRDTEWLAPTYYRYRHHLRYLEGRLRERLMAPAA